MRVSFLILLLSLVIVYAEETKAIFDQTKWNQAVENILSALVSNGFPEHFKPDEIQERVSSEDRIKMQTNRLRGHIGNRLAESMKRYEIICPFSHIGNEAFVQVEKELRQKGWNATWVPDEKIETCGGHTGFLLVSIKK